MDLKDKEKLKRKEVIYKQCGRKYINKDKFAEFNHRKHLYHHYKEYFYDKERGIGI